ncbi:MAG TPA: type II CAAX endopeptidase family protein [Terracidiphilus sp.]|jgi:membrane protease YdiL (CAAX protease family)|nr:type II CAAX endopeptidase family protein [Terracidiphilus sp.]
MRHSQFRTDIDFALPLYAQTHMTTMDAMNPGTKASESSQSTRTTGKQVLLGLASFLLSFALVIGLAFALHGRASFVTQEALSAVVITAAYFLSSHWIENRRPPELNLRGAALEFITGLALGLGLFSSTMGILWCMGIYHPLSWGTFTGLGTGAVFAASAAIVEEILFRAFLFRVLSMAIGTWAAVLITAAFFGAMHAANPGATLSSSAAIALEAGVLLAAAYAITGRLWMPIALHFGWNFAEGSLFGMSVSGGPPLPTFSHGSLNGSALFTGGPFGPEASIVAVLLCLAAGILLLWQTARSQRTQPPMWKHGSRRFFKSPKY